MHCSQDWEEKINFNSKQILDVVPLPTSPRQSAQSHPGAELSASLPSHTALTQLSSLPWAFPCLISAKDRTSKEPGKAHNYICAGSFDAPWFSAVSRFLLKFYFTFSYYSTWTSKCTRLAFCVCSPLTFLAVQVDCRGPRKFLQFFFFFACVILNLSQFFLNPSEEKRWLGDILKQFSIILEVSTLIYWTTARPEHWNQRLKNKITHTCFIISRKEVFALFQDITSTQHSHSLLQHYHVTIHPVH